MPAPTGRIRPAVHPSETAGGSFSLNIQPRRGNEIQNARALWLSRGASRLLHRSGRHLLPLQRTRPCQRVGMDKRSRPCGFACPVIV